MNWDDLRFLLALRRHGTMTAAAHALDTNVTTVSRRIERFGEDLGQPAFYRAPDGWMPAPAVTALLELAEDFANQLDTFWNKMALAQDRVKLVIGAPPEICHSVLLPNVGLLQQTHGGASMSFHNRIYEEGLGDCDIAIKIARPETGRLIVSRVGRLDFRLYRHRDWSGRDWAGLSEIHDRRHPMRVAVEHFGRPPTTRADDMPQLAALIAWAQLAGPLLDPLAGRFADLVPVDDVAHETTYYAAYHASRRGDPVIMAGLAWISECFAMAARETVAG